MRGCLSRKGVGVVDCSSTWYGLFIALAVGIVFGRGSVLVTLPHLRVMFIFGSLMGESAWRSRDRISEREKKKVGKLAANCSENVKQGRGGITIHGRPLLL